MAKLSQIVILLISTYLVSGQRPSFAGSRPIGYPDLQNKTNDELGNRFNDDGEPLPLPIEAKGDMDLVKRISKLPLDKQPFWYINWKALEENRRNPQKYDQRPNVFIDQSSNTANRTAAANRTQNIDLNNQNVLNRNQGSSQTSGLNSRFNTDQPQSQTQAQSIDHYGRRRSNRQY